MTTKPFEPVQTFMPASEQPIDFSRSKEERRTERLKRRVTRKPNDEEEVGLPEGFEFANLSVTSEAEGPVKDDATGLRPTRWLTWTAISFLLMVLVPTAITATYYTYFASPQYQVETQFSVRGSSQSSAAMGLMSIFGGGVQSGDSYIVASYVESLQLIRDIQDQVGLDLRQFYAKPEIDFAYRIDANMPLEEFAEYWRDLNDVSFNSTTGNVTLYVYAFSADDAKTVTDAVLKVSERLVNTLSEDMRKQFTVVASQQVERAEERLRKVREETRKLRVEERAFDPTQIAAMESSLTSSIENQLLALNTRLSALLQSSVSKDSPSAKVMQRQIDALEEQLKLQKLKLGTSDQPSGEVKGDDSNLAEVLNKFEELTVEQGFATQAYTTSLAALETALAEAQKQERYFATFVNPTTPEVALYPKRILDSFVGFLVFLAFWIISQFAYRSFRDHAI